MSIIYLVLSSPLIYIAFTINGNFAILSISEYHLMQTPSTKPAVNHFHNTVFSLFVFCMQSHFHDLHYLQAINETKYLSAFYLRI